MRAGAGSSGAWLGAALRGLPRFPGKARIARRLLGNTSHASDLVVECRGGMRLRVPNLSESVGFHLFVDGVYEPEEVAWVIDRLAPGDVFVDIGANIGAFTVPAAIKVGQTGRVVAIEASPWVSRYLVENIALNRLSNVSVCRVAADDRAGVVPFFEGPTERFGAGSLTPEYGGSEVLAPAARLDDLLEELGIRQVAVLKVDVEGFEHRALAGAERLLRGPSPPSILFEFYDWAERTAAEPGEAQRLLRDWGYTIWTFDAYRRGAPPLTGCLTSGHGGNLVAIRQPDAI